MRETGKNSRQHFSSGWHPLNCIELKYGAQDPLVLEISPSALVADCRGPAGVTGAAASQCIAAAIANPPEGPPIAAHVVPGDRVTLAVAGDVPQLTEIVEALLVQLSSAGVASNDILVLHAPPLEPTAIAVPPLPLVSAQKLIGRANIVAFDPALEAETACLATDEAGQPVHLAKALIDADVVVAIGEWGWNAAIGGQSIDGEIWPTFSRRESREAFIRTLAKRGRRAIADIRMSMQETIWTLGVCASLRVVVGHDQTLAAAAFGLPEAAARQARTHAASWSPKVSGRAMLTVVSLGCPQLGFSALTRAVAAASRVTHPTGTICIASCLSQPPGIIFSRWRQGAPLEGLVHEALQTGDQTLIADALQTRFFARAIGDRRLVLLSELDEGLVEELECGFAETPAVVQRLARRSQSVTVLHEADRMLPQSPENDDD